MRRMWWTNLARLCLLWVVIDVSLPAVGMVAVGLFRLPIAAPPLAVIAFVFGLPAHLVVIILSILSLIASLFRPREQEKRSVIAVAVLASLVWLFFRFFLIFFIITI